MVHLPFAALQHPGEPKRSQLGRDHLMFAPHVAGSIPILRCTRHNRVNGALSRVAVHASFVSQCTKWPNRGHRLIAANPGLTLNDEPPVSHIHPRRIGLFMSKTQTHQSHPEVVNRLRRAEGHLQKIIGMMVEGRSCLELAQQLNAVENAIDNAKKVLIHDHIDNCLEEAAGPISRKARGPLDEFKEITKYL